MLVFVCIMVTIRPASTQLRSLLVMSMLEVSQYFAAPTDAQSAQPLDERSVDMVRMPGCSGMARNRLPVWSGRSCSSIFSQAGLRH
ncbi:hypothetical protein NX80_016295 [Xanthomonas vasicola pv. arecae]|nr:hypothetical protein NX80_016295 [Xanthomonas vasicola pv. arecae]